MPGQRLKELAERDRELREEGRQNPAQYHAIEHQRRIVRAAIRNLPESEFADASFVPLHRENYKPARRIGWGWGVLALAGMVLLTAAAALHSLGAL